MYNVCKVTVGNDFWYWQCHSMADHGLEFQVVQDGKSMHGSCPQAGLLLDQEAPISLGNACASNHSQGHRGTRRLTLRRLMCKHLKINNKAALPSHFHALPPWGPCIMVQKTGKCHHFPSKSHSDPTYCFPTLPTRRGGCFSPTESPVG